MKKLSTSPAKLRSTAKEFADIADLKIEVDPDNAKLELWDLGERRWFVGGGRGIEEGIIALGEAFAERTRVPLSALNGVSIEDIRVKAGLTRNIYDSVLGKLIESEKIKLVPMTPQ